MASASTFTWPATATFTPGDAAAVVAPGGRTQTPASPSLGQRVPGTGLPLWGLLALVAVLVLFEHRRIRKGH